jgi:hypothetical protein
LGVSENALVDGEAQDIPDLLGALGIYNEAGTLPGLTDDEKAIIRVLHICDKDVAHAAVSAITAGFEEKKFSTEVGRPRHDC